MPNKAETCPSCSGQKKDEAAMLSWMASIEQRLDKQATIAPAAPVAAPAEPAVQTEGFESQMLAAVQELTSQVKANTVLIGGLLPAQNAPVEPAPAQAAEPAAAEPAPAVAEAEMATVPAIEPIHIDGLA